MKKQLAIAITVALASGSVYAAGTNIGYTVDSDIETAIATQYGNDLESKAGDRAVVKASDASDGNSVSLTQDSGNVSGDSHLSVVELVNSDNNKVTVYQQGSSNASAVVLKGNGNKTSNKNVVTVKQFSSNNDSVVHLNGADENVNVSVTQRASDNDSIVNLKKADGNYIIVDQNTNNKSTIEATGVNAPHGTRSDVGNRITVKQQGSGSTSEFMGLESGGNTIAVTQATGDYSNIDMIDSSDNTNVSVKQSGTGVGNEATIYMNGADSNLKVAITQNSNINRAGVALINSDSNRDISITQGQNNDAGILLHESDNNKVTIVQKQNNKFNAPGWDGAGVGLSYSSNNNLSVNQGENNAALVGAFESNNNTIALTQTSNNDAAILLEHSGSEGTGNGNSVIVKQNDSNYALVHVSSSDGNVVTLDQSFGNTAFVDVLNESDYNKIDIDQFGSNALATVHLSGSAMNVGDNALAGTKGIYIRQSDNDFANVSLTNSNANAIQIVQK
ncbi:hypothetical protein L4D20_20530 [Vibrio kyushuensis]|uniref:hypothetical protein n=1 Tax=Vibrio kyushuensis TaxID=2910249 RepID=UPI003D0C1BB4